MNKIERVSRALLGEEVDRPPFSFWYHFGLQHMPGHYHAQAELDFYRAYHVDFLKVMNDYPYPMPTGIETLQTEEDWRRLEPLPATHGCWAEQLTALSLIEESIGTEALFIDTIFSPWTTARRLAGEECLNRMRRDHPEMVLDAMNSIAVSLAGYATEALGRGASGIFLSLGAASDDVMSVDEYAVWCRPFDLTILSAVSSAPFNVLHIHGNHIHFDSLIDYPVNAINWSHFSAGPSLVEGQRLSRKAVMGGIDETRAAHLSPPDLRRQVDVSLSEAGATSLLLTPGCSVPTDTPKANLEAIREAIRSSESPTTRVDCRPK